MNQVDISKTPPGRIRRLALPSMLLAALAAGSALTVMATRSSPAVGEATPAKLPDPPANGELGFVVDHLAMPFVPGLESCPDGLVPTLREAYLGRLPADERARLSLKENEPELTRRWQAEAVGPNGTNICSQPDKFDRPLLPVLKHPQAWGMDLDKGDPDTCAHDEFTSPRGETGIDNQEYRVMGCWAGLRGKDGTGGELNNAYKQFLASGEWAQVILLKGVDSLQNDPDVEVIYGNTPDRPVTDSKGAFLRGISFTISDRMPRFRNVLKGRIVNGVLTTEPKDIELTQTWGQGGARDIRGNRSRFTFRKGRLRLAFQPDGSLTGMIGGYRPVFEGIQSPALGGIGSAIVAGIDCAANLATMRAMADGIRDPKTGKCTALSSVQEINAIPAFVTDVPQSRLQAGSQVSR